MSEQVQAPVTSEAPAPVAPVVAPIEPAKADAPKVEAQAVEPAKIEVHESVSKHFAEIERRRAALEHEKRTFAAQQKADEADRKAFAEWRAQRDEAKKDPIKGFGMLGMSVDDVAKALATAPQLPTEIEKFEAKLAALQAKIDADEQAKVNAEKAREAQAQAARDAENIKIAQTQIEKVLAADDFEITRSHGKAGVDLVFVAATQHFKEQGDAGVPEHERIVWPLEKYAAIVEAQYERIADTAAATEKYKRKLSAKVDVPKTADAPKTADKKPVPAEPKVVLSNKTTADTPPGDPPDDAAAKRQRAIQKINERWAAKRASFAKKGL